MSLHAQTETSPLDRLEHHTGWITVLTTVPGHPDGDSDYFEIVRPAGKVAKVPGIGDDIKMRHKQQVIILGFHQTGESRRLEFPGDSRLSKDDVTNIELAVGAIIRVAEIREAKPVGRVTEYWARIEPARTK